jgi:hypothetical protein
MCVFLVLRCDFFLSILGEEAWNTLMSLPCSQDLLGASRVLTADVITKNGFKIEICYGMLTV